MHSPAMEVASFRHHADAKTWLDLEMLRKPQPTERHRNVEGSLLGDSGVRTVRLLNSVLLRTVFRCSWTYQV